MAASQHWGAAIVSERSIAMTYTHISMFRFRNRD